VALERSFRTPATEASFFGAAFPVMQSVLPPLATLLMQTPIERKADPDYGPNAGPGFAYRKRTVPALVAEAEHLLAHPPHDLGTDYRQAWTEALQATLDQLRAIGATEAAAT
jgi:hypothetical protein